LKTTRFNLEKWQQKKPLALFKRFIVAFSVVLIFKLANSDENTKKSSSLVKLSGKLMEKGKEYTLSKLYRVIVFKSDGCVHKRNGRVEKMCSKVWI
jgi:hypothetical protein